mmetsp:Transcript_68746/g.173198  ORF Transcript_68746/g.173198 Transcript_68746/m.173198 type:complete len:248 (-) Transcript_68746:374-1117(-)
MLRIMRQIVVLGAAIRVLPEGAALGQRHIRPSRSHCVGRSGPQQDVLQRLLATHVRLRPLHGGRRGGRRHGLQHESGFVVLALVRHRRRRLGNHPRPPRNRLRDAGLPGGAARGAARGAGRSPGIRPANEAHELHHRIVERGEGHLRHLLSLLFLLHRVCAPRPRPPSDAPCRCPACPRSLHEVLAYFNLLKIHNQTIEPLANLFNNTLQQGLQAFTHGQVCQLNTILHWVVICLDVGKLCVWMVSL